MELECNEVVATQKTLEWSATGQVQCINKWIQKFVLEYTGQCVLQYHDCSCIMMFTTLIIGSVRLVNQNSLNHQNSLSGRVEVWSNGAWGTVCDDSWDLFDTAVVCHQLDYEHTLSAPHRAAFGRGSGPIWLDDVACVGNESSIFNCTHLGIGVHNCGHYSDASAVCYKGELCMSATCIHAGIFYIITQLALHV